MRRDPTAYCSIGAPVEHGDVVFVIEAGYHLLDAIATGDVLASRGVGTAMVAPEPPSDVLRHLRASTARHREIVVTAGRDALHLGPQLSPSEVVDRARVLVVRNDWGPSSTLVELARSADVATVGWVEGVQDFDDVDTGRVRAVYSRVDHVFSLGNYDAARLASRPHVEIVGSERLWRRWFGPPTSAELPLLANVNFTYGVGRADRRGWVDDVLAAARRSGTPVRISHHPADRGIRGRSRELRGGTDLLMPSVARLVSRFSTTIYDALVLGVDVIYHNPHRERTPTFTEPLGAFETTASRDQLVAALRRPPESPDVLRRRSTDFLHHHLRLEGEPPSQRAARLLAEMTPT